MAGSRVHKLGSIFERVSGMLESGVYKEVDKPLWYDVYKKFPPKYNPRFDRKTPSVEIKKIYYVEDIIRAKVQKELHIKAFDLRSNVDTSDTNHLINSCQEIMTKNRVSVDEAIKIMKDANVNLRQRKSK